MAGWISSKLKAAETLLQQIDQQAAESLGKTDKPLPDELNYVSPTKSESVVPLKDQLKKKTADNNIFHSQSRRNFTNHLKVTDAATPDKEISTIPKHSPNSGASLTDSDWTELLGTPNQTKTPVGNHTNGLAAIRGLKKDGRKHVTSGSSSSAVDTKRIQNNQSGAPKIVQSPETVSETKSNGKLSNRKPSDGEETRLSVSSQGASSIELKGKDEAGGFKLVDSGSIIKPNGEANQEINSTPLLDNNHPLEMVSELKIGGADNRKMHDKKGAFSSVSDERSDSDTESSATSGSESEHEREERRKRRERILAEKAAAKAVEAIKERENLLARLEGEKQSLEKILEERANQQAREASELQMTMMETMEAVDLEKQKHNTTRMEALARLATLETANADLAKSLATAQWKLEVEVNRVADLRRQIELKELAQEELRRRTSNTHHAGVLPNHLAAQKGIEFEREILEAEYSLVTDKIARLQEKAKKLEANIELARRETEETTEVEIELKRRLSQLTDHLIQKQAQVEALSSEKAMILFRIEAVSRLLDENKSMLNTTSGHDLESGTWELSNSKLKPLFEDRIRSGRKQLNLLIVQLDAIFSAGAVFLRRNSTAKMWALVYLLCLHFWVIYILLSRSNAADEAQSGAVISLVKINNTAGL